MARGGEPKSVFGFPTEVNGRKLLTERGPVTVNW